MQTSSIAKDYANIFYQVCEENNIVDEVLYESKMLQKIHIGEVRKILSIPVIGKDVKKDLVLSLKEANYRDETINLLLVLLDNDQANIFGEVIAAFQEIYQQKNDILIVHVTCAKQLSSDTLDNVRKSLEKSLGKFVIVLTEIDENVIGGIKIEYEGKVIDNTISAQLKKIQELKVS